MVGRGCFPHHTFRGAKQFLIPFVSWPMVSVCVCACFCVSTGCGAEQALEPLFMRDESCFCARSSMLCSARWHKLSMLLYVILRGNRRPDIRRWAVRCFARLLALFSSVRWQQVPLLLCIILLAVVPDGLSHDIFRACLAVLCGVFCACTGQLASK